MAKSACPHPHLDLTRTRNQATIWIGLIASIAAMMDATDKVIANYSCLNLLWTQKDICII